MNNQEFYKLYDEIIIKVANKIFEEVSEEDKREYVVFLSDLHSAYGVKPSIKRNFDSNLYRVVKQGFFNENIDFMKCIKISSICDALLRNKIICFTVKEKIPTDILLINYKIALEVVIESLICELEKEIGYVIYNKGLIYPTEDFNDLLLLSIIVNDNTPTYMFDVLTFASMLLLLYEYNKEKTQE